MGRWKNGAQCAVMLTFDVDAETLWLAGDLTNLDKPGLLSIGTYGARVAVPLILNLLKENNLKATFFVPGWTAETHADLITAEEAARRGGRFEVRRIIEVVQNRPEAMALLKRGGVVPGAALEFTGNNGLVTVSSAAAEPVELPADVADGIQVRPA